VLFSDVEFECWIALFTWILGTTLTLGVVYTCWVGCWDRVLSPDTR
jgi:hypothetical protein